MEETAQPLNNEPKSENQVPESSVGQEAEKRPSDIVQIPVMDPTIMLANGTGDLQTLQEMVPSAIYQTGAQQQITADEIALYDRQIRLWGVQAQEKLRSARIVLVGIKGLASEVAKNLVLAGVGSITIVDHEMVTEDDLGAQFFLSQENIGQNRAQAALGELQKLNPRVNLVADPDMIFSKPPEYFANFDITIATDLDIDTFSMINASCRINSRKFYAAATHGMYGFVFADLLIHDFVIERAESNKPTEINRSETNTRMVLASSLKKENGKSIEMVTKRETYSPLILANSSPLAPEITGNRRRRLQVTPLLSCLRALFEFQKQTGGRSPSHNRQDLQIFTRMATERHHELLLPTETLRAEFLRSFLQNLNSEVTPVAAFLGGSLAQDVINVLGQREQPLQNLLLFDGEDFKGPIYSLHPIFPEVLPFSSTGFVGNGVSLDGAIPALLNDENGTFTGMDVSGTNVGILPANEI